MGDVVGGRKCEVASGGSFASQPRVLGSLNGQSLNH